jgi:Sensors of blue-light using FAD
MLTSTLYEALYVSTIAPTASFSVVSEIAGKSRVYNAARGLTGLLIFDGAHFCQQIEGSQREVLRLIELISSDSRHTDVTVFYHGVLAERRFRSFALAFTDGEDIDALPRLAQLEGKVGLAAFIELTRSIELEA